ncbi:MAG: GGDEF domain-containing protein [Betaproteobacteria bacterium]
MTIPDRKPPKSKNGAVALAKALRQNECANVLVAETARELSCVNGLLKQELAEKKRLPVVENAIEQIEKIEENVLQVSEGLAVVNETLEVQVRSRIMIEHQFAAAVEQGEASRHAAFHDALTGLPNRALFQDRLEHGLMQAVRHGWNLAVMFVDLDAFKAINDTHGHAAGDRVLQAVAERLKKNVRSDDSICRHGGDEFLCLLMDTRDQRDLGAIAEKIISAIQAPCEVGIGNDVITVHANASIGIALFPQHGTTPDDLINNADVAMYCAKQGASRVEFAT